MKSIWEAYNIIIQSSTLGGMLKLVLRANITLLGFSPPTYYNVLLQNKLKVVQQGGKVCKHGSSEGRNKNKLKERVNQSVASCQLNFVIDRSVKYQRA